MTKLQPDRHFSPIPSLLHRIIDGIAKGISPPIAADSVHQAKIDAAKTNLLDFVTFTNSLYEVNWHHKTICDRLMRWINREIKNLMLFVPPRYGKSTLASQYLPAFLFGIKPDTQVILASYAASLAAFMNRQTQQIMDGEAYREIFPDTRLSGKNIRTVAGTTWLRNSEEFQIVGRRGHYRCAGVGGGLSGRGAEYLLLDDPYKDRAEADSPTIRNRVKAWYTSVFRTRCNTDQSGMCIIQTRWREDDLSGWLMDLAASNLDADQWEVVSFPAVKEDDSNPDDPRKIGEPLWQNRFSAESLETTRVSVGPYDWNSIFQQKPTVPGGAVFQRDHFRYFRILEREGKRGLEKFVQLDCDDKHKVAPTEFPLAAATVFQVVDTAKKLSDSAKYTAVITFAALTCRAEDGAVLRRVLLVIDAWREKLLINEQYKILLEVRQGKGEFDARTRSWKQPPSARPFPKTAEFQFVENAGSGEGLLQQAAADGVPMCPVEASASKVARASVAAVLYQQGTIYHLEGMRNLGIFESELQDFPTGTYADQVDCVGHAAFLFNTNRFLAKGLDSMFVYPNAADVAKREMEGAFQFGEQTIIFPDDEERRDNPWR